MKKLQEIEEQISLDKFGCILTEALPQMDGLDIIEFTDKVAKLYAQQCCEDLRERIAVEAMLTEKNWIRKVEIILP